MMAAIVLVAGVLPVSATAPGVRDLPRVVIGDSGALDQAFDINNYVDWYGQFVCGSQTINFDIDTLDPEEGFHVYICDPTGLATPVTATDDLGANVPAVTATDVANMKVADILSHTAATPVLPMVNEWDKNIFNAYPTTVVQRWMSLKTAASDDVAFVAFVRSDITTGTAKLMEVTKTTGDSGANYARDFAGYALDDGFAEWASETNPSIGAVMPVYNPTNRPSIGWDCSANDSNLYFSFGTWKAWDGPLTNLIPADGGLGVAQPVFEAKALLWNNTTAGSIDYCPGYRLLVLNGAMSHLSAFAFTHGAPLPIVAPAPYNGPNIANSYTFIARLYWATPLDLTQMADGEQVSLYAPAATILDGRDYALQFDVVDLGGDRGMFSMRALSIRTFDAATDFVAASPLSWTGADIAAWSNQVGHAYVQNDPSSFYSGKVQGATGIRRYTPQAGWTTSGDPLAAALRLWAHDENQEPYNYSTQRYLNSTFNNTVEANRYQMLANQLLRVTVNALSGYDPALNKNRPLPANSDATDIAPTIRLLCNDYLWNAAAGAAQYRYSTWYDMWGNVGATFKAMGPSRVLSPLQKAPTVPKLTGSTASLYMWTHKAGSLVDKDFVQPELQVFSLGQFAKSASINEWPDEQGFIEVSNVTIETLTANAAANVSPLYDPNEAAAITPISVYSVDFRDGLQGWGVPTQLDNFGITANGLEFDTTGGDPSFSSPAITFPGVVPCKMTIYASVTGVTTAGQLYVNRNSGWAEPNVPINFMPINDLGWTDFEMTLPLDLGAGKVLEGAYNFRCDICSSAGAHFAIQTIDIETIPQ